MQRTQFDRSHEDARRARNAESELKIELTRSKKEAVAASDQALKYKKELDRLERLKQDEKDKMASLQQEVKELKAKLQVSGEQEHPDGHIDVGN